MRVLVARPAEAAEKTAAKLRRRGHQPICAPALEIVSIPALAPDETDFGLALASSANAFAGWRPKFWRGDIACVGEKTAQAARKAGFSPRWIAPDAVKLVEILRENLSPQCALYLAGRERKNSLEQGLGAAGWRLRVVETYATAEVLAWPKSVLAMLEAGEIDAMLHYSPRSARAALRLAGPAAARTRHLCLSDDIAAEVAALLGPARILVASQADEEALHLLLDAF